MQKVFLTKLLEMECCHSLPNYQGSCSKMHGHSYKVEVTVSGLIDNKSNELHDNMVYDFKDLNRLIKGRIIYQYDHENLNNFFEVPTAEAMAVSFFNDLNPELPTDVKLEAVKVWETSTSYAEYRGEEVE